jgi:hypothetical protein
MTVSLAKISPNPSMTPLIKGRMRLIPTTAAILAIER